jgi:choline dehydrogenase-like flavoprotein
VTFLDANHLPDATPIDADICIVGSGAAGITVASELDGSSETVCLMESGDYGPDEDTQALYDLTVVGHAVRENFMSRARYFGGTCNVWAGRSMRLTPLDFERRDWVPHSGWPIPYAEVERYYPRAAAILRLPSWDAVRLAVSTDRMSPAERSLFDNADLRPSVAIWGKRPLRFGKAYRRQLQASRNISVCLKASVIDIQLNPAATHVDACTAVSPSGNALRLRAKRFVLACGGLETARLLLASRSVRTTGVGNQYDVVGRYYMDHPRAVFGQVKLPKWTKFGVVLGTPLANGMAQLGIQLSDGVQRRERLLNHHLTLERHWSDHAARTYQSFVHSMKVLLRKGYAGRRFDAAAANLSRVPELIYLLAPRELMPHSLYRAARMLRQRLSKGVSELTIVNYCEQIPNPCSRVYLGDDRDRFGVPRLVLDWVINREESDSVMRLHALVDNHLRRHELGSVVHPAELSEALYTDASHHIGTARMSATPRDGVVDEHCRVHGVDNLFIAGSAVFPTAGHANPTLTIVALAIRLAERLRRLST